MGIAVTAKSVKFNSTQTERAMTLDDVLNSGFDKSYETDDGIRVRCSQCEALCINGVPCHETGCPNVVKDEPDDDEYFDDDDFDRVEHERIMNEDDAPED